MRRTTWAVTVGAALAILAGQAVFAQAASTGAAAKPANSQQEKMKACNAEATAKALKGDERKTFMSGCLKGSGSAAGK